MTDKTKEKIQYLCPDVMFAANPAKWIITLAVVLRAIEKVMKPDWQINLGTTVRDRNNKLVWTIQVTHDSGGRGAEWNLEHDNYDQQSEETRAFIGSLLGV